jgi:hypothetical protein
MTSSRTSASSYLYFAPGPSCRPVSYLFNGWVLVEPFQDFFARLAFARALVELFTDAFRQAGNFTCAGSERFIPADDCRWLAADEGFLFFLHGIFLLHYTTYMV